jgi:hypothetical protein
LAAPSHQDNTAGGLDPKLTQAIEWVVFAVRASRLVSIDTTSGSSLRLSEVEVIRGGLSGLLEAEHETNWPCCSLVTTPRLRFEVKIKLHQC